MRLRIGCVIVGLLSLALSLAAQSANSSPASAQVPPLIQFSNVATDEGGNTLSGVVSLTFSLYTSQQGGEPLWTETQSNVPLDPTGHYSVQLGITKPNGVPTALFTTGEARWLGVRIAEQAEQPRVLLLSVPYALKAGDAATIGGLPPSAFVLAAPPVSGGNVNNEATASASPSSASSSSVPATTSDVTTTGGTVNAVPLFSTSTNIQNSIVTQSGTTSVSVAGALKLPATGTATSAAGKNSRPQDFVASSFNSTTSTAENQTFQWQAEPASNDTTSPSGTLNLLYGLGATAPSETGLKLSSTGQFTFATGQTFPGTGDGTVTSVASGDGLTGGPITGSGTLSIPSAGVTNAMLANSKITLNSGTGITAPGAMTLGDTYTVSINTSVVPELAAANTFTGNQTVNGNLSATGVVTGSSFQIGSNLFDYGSYGNANAFLGFAGGPGEPNHYVFSDTAVGYQALAADGNNGAGEGGNNTAVGFQALYSSNSGSFNVASGVLTLYSNISGNLNSAFGSSALYNNTTGSYNTASGVSALNNNTTGSYNTASGSTALYNNTTGTDNTALGNFAGNTLDHSNLTTSNNTAVGSGAGFSTGGTISNATAIGSDAVVSESNALVLGSIPGLGYGTAGVNVGIGTTDPSAPLHIAGPASDPPSGLSSADNGLLMGLDSNSTYKWMQSYGGPLAINPIGQNVGIGTSAPDTTLSVNGGADKPGGGSWGTFSDGRLKNLNGSYSSGLSQILRINPIRYRYKPDNAMGIRDTDEHIGVVAQEVQRVIPEAVTENNKGYLLVNNDPIIWSMVNAIKEQQQEIKQQQELLRAQAAALRSLKAEVRETRASLRKVQAQIAAGQPALVAAK
jgi:hypothetical protein